MTVEELATAIQLDPAVVSRLIGEEQDISADAALRLSRYFGTTPEFWMNLQLARDISLALSKTDYSSIRPRS